MWRAMEEIAKRIRYPSPVGVAIRSFDLGEGRFLKATVTDGAYATPGHESPDHKAVVSRAPAFAGTKSDALGCR